jgi:hypothetical protein
MATSTAATASFGERRQGPVSAGVVLRVHRQPVLIQGVGRQQLDQMFRTIYGREYSIMLFIYEGFKIIKMMYLRHVCSGK